MTITRIRFEHKGGMRLQLESPYFDQLVRNSDPDGKGRLPTDVAAHALWHYYCVASVAWHNEVHGLVYEGERDHSFNAKECFESIAKVHGVPPQDMSRYWNVILQQRIALGLTSNAELPERFKFRFH